MPGRRRTQLSPQEGVHNIEAAVADTESTESNNQEDTGLGLSERPRTSEASSVTTSVLEQSGGGMYCLSENITSIV